MNDICKAILHIVFAILCALLANQERTVWVVWFVLGSVVSAWRAIELFMGDDIF